MVTGLVDGMTVVLLLEIQRRNEATSQIVARIADDQRHRIAPLLQAIIEHNKAAPFGLP